MKNMNTKKITTLIVPAAALVALPACNDFLDEMPDNRTELDSSDKITSLLVSAYSEHTYPVTCEYASDNVDETALVSPDFEPEQEEYYRWQDVTAAVTNEAPQAVWSQYYMAIAAANQALDAIKELGGADTPQLKAAKGEALICRGCGKAFVRPTIRSMRRRTLAFPTWRKPKRYSTPNTPAVRWPKSTPRSTPT